MNEELKIRSILSRIDALHREVESLLIAGAFFYLRFKSRFEE